jgi:hypothetical protein
MGGGLSSDAVGRLQRLDGGDDAVAFLQALVDPGSNSYTARTDGLGLVHFLTWWAYAGPRGPTRPRGAADHGGSRRRCRGLLDRPLAAHTR